MVLQRETNAGKTLFVDSFLTQTEPEEIPRERDNSGFRLYKLPTATSYLFEEPLITPINIGTWKLLLEGKLIKTDIKHKDKERIHRIPIYITTTHCITNNVDDRGKSQLFQRIKIFKFDKTIQNRSEDYTKTTYNQNTLNKPPNPITFDDFNALFIEHYEEIYKYINECDKQNTLDLDRLELTTPEQLCLNVNQTKL